MWSAAARASASRRRSTRRRSVVVLGHEVERLAVEDRRLVLRPAELGLLAGADEVVDRAARLAGVAPVARERASPRRARRSSSSKNARPRACRSCAPRPRQQVVGDVADQDVLEAVLLLALDDRHSSRGGPGRGARARRAARRCRRLAGDPLERAAPEDLADNGGVEQQRPLGGGQRVEPGGDDPADRRRQRVARAVDDSAIVGGELLDEERVALGGLGEPRARLARSSVCRAAAPASFCERRSALSGSSGSAV